jgi:hypothetical protein
MKDRNFNNFFILFIVFSNLNCLYENLYIKKARLAINQSKEEKMESRKVVLERCSLIAFFYIKKGEQRGGNVLEEIFVEDPSRKEVTFHNANISIRSLDYFPPLTFVLFFLPIPMLPVVRICAELNVSEPKV